MSVFKVAVIGDADSVIGFRGLGVKVIVTENTELALHEMEELARDDYGVIYLTEALAEQEPLLTEQFRTSLMPAVILIPSSRGGEGYGMERLRDQVKRAVGMDIMGGNTTLDDK